MGDYICPAEPEITHCYNAAKVRELIRAARADALEEAAKVAENMHALAFDDINKKYGEGVYWAADEIAAAICAIKEKQP